MPNIPGPISPSADPRPDANPRPNANPRIVEALYEEALALADRARAEFETLRRRETIGHAANDVAPPTTSHAGPAEDLVRVQASCEALRTTTRITHCLAWLLNHRAWFAGELTALQMRRHGRLIAHFPASDPACVAHLPPAARSVVGESERLYQRIARLEQAWQESASPPHALPNALPLALTRLRERLGLALAEAG
jgi:regulator of CtrA degradation